MYWACIDLQRPGSAKERFWFKELGESSVEGFIVEKPVGKVSQRKYRTIR
jgi:hypothetical protein